jgi:alpha-glucoside transport system substrate-binding protein
VSYRPAKKFAATIVGISAVALVLTACSSSNSSSSSTSAAATSAAASSATGSAGASAAAGPVGATSGWCDAVKAKYGDLTGKTVSIYSVITAPEDAGYVTAYKAFTDCTGAQVTYESSKEFEAQLGVRVQSGNPPDLAIFPQPGLLKKIVETTGSMKPLPDDVKAEVAKYYPQDWSNYGVVNDISFGIPNNADYKSLVWYSPKTFKEKGYTVPTNWDELKALYEKIAATEPPWCIGIGSGDATGWQLTDWLEEYVLRLQGPDVYDQWVSHDVKFSDPPIASSLAEVGALLKDPKYVNAGFGGVKTIASTQFTDPAAQVLSGKCTLTRQAANYDANFPKGTTFGPDGDIDAFPFPPFNDKFGNTVLGGGTFYGAFADRPEVQAFQTFVASPEYVNLRAQQGSYISSNLGLQADSVPGVILKEALKGLQDPKTVFRFDASDLMPAEVGSSAEWKQFTAWITGQDDATTLANIDAAWPTS